MQGVVSKSYHMFQPIGLHRLRTLSGEYQNILSAFPTTFNTYDDRTLF